MPINPDPDLMRIFNFTADDLEANRAGKLSERQIERLAERRNRDRRIAGIGCLVVIIIALWMIQMVLSPSAPENSGSTILIFLIIGGLIVGYIYLGAMDRQTDLNRRKVESDVNEINVWESRGKWGERDYDISIYPLSYRISKSFYMDVQAYLRQKGTKNRFRVYYAPESKELLSIEVVDKS